MGTKKTELKRWRLVRWYGVWGGLRLFLDFLHTRLRFAGARLVRRPSYVRGRRWMNLGPGLTAGPGLRLDAEPLTLDDSILLTVGKDVQLNDSVHIAATQSVRIGDRVLIASKVLITDHNHGTYSGDGVHSDPRLPPAERALFMAPVVIEDDVWIGEFVAILPGVTIGRGAIIGTLSVVNRDIPSYTIAVGNPARVIKRYNFDTSRWDRV